MAASTSAGQEAPATYEGQPWRQAQDESGLCRRQEQNRRVVTAAIAQQGRTGWPAL